MANGVSPRLVSLARGYIFFALMLLLFSAILRDAKLRETCRRENKITAWSVQFPPGFTENSWIFNVHGSRDTKMKGKRKEKERKSGGNKAKRQEGNGLPRSYLLGPTFNYNRRIVPTIKPYFFQRVS
jgi:hypothetical protein